MDTFEFKREQLKLAAKITLHDRFTVIKTIGAAVAIALENKLLAAVVVLDYKTLELKEKKTFLLDNPLPYKPGYVAYREMPAIIEAYNKLEEEPDILLINGTGINHPRKIGIASHAGLALNKPTIGVMDKLLFGKIDHNKIITNDEISGFEVKTREYAKPIYVSPGNHITLGSVLHVIQKVIRYPHKMPEPLHIAHKVAKKKAKTLR